MATDETAATAPLQGLETPQAQRQSQGQPQDPQAVTAAAVPEHGVEPGDAEPGVMDAPPPKKNLSGRQKLLRGLSRISSSPALAQLGGRPRAQSSPYGSGSSFSCVSLSSGSGSSPFSGGSQTPSSFFFPSQQASPLDGPNALASAASTPGTPFLDSSPLYDGIEARLGARRLDDAEAAAALSMAGGGGGNATAPLPAEVKSRKSAPSTFQLWPSMPHEIKVHILAFLRPRELVRVSRVSKDFYKTCFDGQLWTCFDASEFYKEIPADLLAKIITSAGPFVKDLNLRGCMQVEHYKRAEVVVKACRNLINATLEGCRNFQRSTLHSLLRSNEKLASLNLTGLGAVTNATCKIISESCHQLEVFNVSWCKHVDARGIKMVVERCPRLRDLRAGEVRGFDSHEVAEAIFRTNNLRRLVLSGCSDLTDAALRAMVHGSNPEVDVLTDRPIVPQRRLRHLDLSRCTHLTHSGLRALGHLVPGLETLQLSGCSALDDAALEPVLATAPLLTHLELEDIPELTNAVLAEHLAKAPCAARLEHLTVSYCENVGDAGLLPVLRACRALRVVEMDNTRASDLVLAEAAAMVRARAARTMDKGSCRPRTSLQLVVYDCQNVTWTGVREVLSRNAEVVKVAKPVAAAMTQAIAAVKAPTLAAAPPQGSKEEEEEGQEGQEGQEGAQTQVQAEAPAQIRTQTMEEGMDVTMGEGNPLSEEDAAAHDPDHEAPTTTATTATTTTTTTTVPTSPPPPPPPAYYQTYPTEVIALKCFFSWQMTVDEHTKRVLRGDLPSALRLERKWADYMQASEEAGAGGAGVRRRRRRAREAALAHADEEDGGGGLVGGLGGANGGGVGRRRARTAACVVM